MAYCSQCGTETVKGAKFCFECGAAIVEPPMPEETPSPNDSEAPIALAAGTEDLAAEREAEDAISEEPVSQAKETAACGDTADDSAERNEETAAATGEIDVPDQAEPPSSEGVQSEIELVGTVFSAPDTLSQGEAPAADPCVELKAASVPETSPDIAGKAHAKKALVGCIAAACLALVTLILVLSGPSEVEELGISPVPEAAIPSSLEWPESGAGVLAPKPDHPFGTVSISDVDAFEATLEYADAETLSRYAALCKEQGFTIELTEGNESFKAENGWGCSLEASLDAEESDVAVKLVVPESSVLKWPSANTASSLLPTPGFPYGSVLEDTDTRLSAVVRNAAEEDFKDYVAACVAEGYTVDAADAEGSFVAGNGWGCSLEISLDAESKDMFIDLTVDDGSLLRWPAEGCATLLPSPSKIYGSVLSSSDLEFEAIVKCISKADFDSYTAECAKLGFSVNPEKGEASYAAENDVKGSLVVEWAPEAEEMRITLDSPIVHTVDLTVDCRENWFFNQYAIDVYMDDVKLGSLDHGDKGTYSLILEEGFHVLKATKKDSADLSGTCDLYVGADMQVGFNANCNSSNVGLSVFSEHKDLILPPLEEGETRISFSSSTYSGKPYPEVVEALKEMGFSNVKEQAIYDLNRADGGWFGSSEGDVESVTIAGATSYSRGEVFSLSDEVVVAYHSCVWNEPGFAFAKYSVSTLVDELSGNALRANETYTGAYVEVTGVLESVDEDGTFYLYPDNAWWSPYQVACFLSSGDQKAEVAKMSAGDRVTVRGRIITVGDVLGYSMDVIDIL